MIKLTNVTKEYQLGGETFTALDNITLTIKDGEYVTIIGPSGSGKSTLMHIMGLLDLPTRGTVFYDDTDVSGLTDNALSTFRNETIGFVFQQFNLLNKFTILENIMLPSVYARKTLDFNPRKRAHDLIEQVGLSGKEKSYPNKISGGQQQRVAIARALMMRPKIILADEPTGNIDSKTGLAILDLLESLNREYKVTLAIITHDLEIAKRPKRMIKIKDGRVE